MSWAGDALGVWEVSPRCRLRHASLPLSVVGVGEALMGVLPTPSRAPSPRGRTFAARTAFAARMRVLGRSRRWKNAVLGWEVRPRSDVAGASTRTAPPESRRIRGRPPRLRRWPGFVGRRSCPGRLRWCWRPAGSSGRGRPLGRRWPAGWRTGHPWPPGPHLVTALVNGLTLDLLNAPPTEADEVIGQLRSGLGLILRGL